MFEAAGKAFYQMFTPPFRRVLLQAIGLAILVMVLIAIGLHRALAWLAASGASSVTGVNVTDPSWLWSVVIWFASFATGLGLFAGAVFLMPAVTAFVGSFFVDEIADEVERRHYSHEPPGRALPLWRALVEGIKTALLAVAVYLCAAPLLLFAGLGFIIMFLANAYLLGREYFLLAAMRFLPAGEAKALRRLHRTNVFLGGMVIALFVSVPVLNLAAPLFATAFMVHLHKRLSGSQTKPFVRA